MHDRLDGFVYSKQREILRSLVEHRHTAVPSCFDSGKSFTASTAAAWWLDVHPPGEAFVVTTAPTDPQVKAILWREIRRRFKDAMAVGDPLPGRVTLDAQWKLDDGELIGYGRKPADHDQTAFQGIHARYVLVLMDEADGIPQALYDAVEGLVTNENARVLAIGNPYDPTGPFADACKPGSGWNVVHISYTDTPNFSGEDVPATLRDLLISPTWVDERRRTWGEGTPRWISKVEGRFPEVTTDAIVEPRWVEAAMRRTLRPDIADSTLGVDVARYGDDDTVVVLREGTVARVVGTWSKEGTMTTAGRVIRLHRDHDARPPIHVDDVGVGGGVTDRIREQGYPVAALVGGSSPRDRDMFKNARSEWWWNLRLLFEEGSIDLDPADEDLAAQLVAVKYKIDSRGRIQVESKEDMAKRGVSSPDRADALVYACAEGVPVISGADRDTPADGGGLTGDLMSKRW